MYILFYPLKFPSTPVLTLFKVLQHHNNLLWPQTGLEPAFIHWYRDYLQTCAYFLIQHLAARDTVSLPVRLCILHTPLRLGWLFHLPSRSYGREDRTRTCDPWFPKPVFCQLNYFPIIAVFHNTSAQLPWELVSFTITSDFHRRSPRVCTLPLWNSNRLLTYIFIIFNHQCPFLNAFILFW